MRIPPLIAMTLVTTAVAIVSISLPDAPADGVALDYLAVDRGRHRVWVPAGGTGNTVVIDTTTRELHKIDKFPTKEVERQGKKSVVGPSSATIGEGFVYVGNRVARKKEVWVTMPRDNAIATLDVSKPSKSD